MNEKQYMLVINIGYIIIFFMENQQKQQTSFGCQTGPITIDHHPKTSNSNFCPFLSKATRHPLVDLKNKNLPAPGTYKIKSAFSGEDSRDELYRECRVVLYNTKKIKENVCFKSTSQRFSKPKVINELPFYDYNVSNGKNKTQKSLGKSKYQAQSALLRNKKLHCPSIPDKSNKYGYRVNGENFNKIIKSEKQLQNDRQSMKQYVKQLMENKYQNEIYESMKSSRVPKIERQIKKVLNSHQNLISECKYDKNRGEFHRKIIKSPIAKGNHEAIEKVKITKEICSQNLGPGRYQHRDDFLNQKRKDKKYQFFNSTEQRFLDESRVSAQPKVSFQSKKGNNRLRQFNQSLKKPTHTAKINKDEYYIPGPGDYQVSEVYSKVKTPKNGTINKAQRFNNDPLKKSNIKGCSPLSEKSKENINVTSYECIINNDLTLLKPIKPSNKCSNMVFQTNLKEMKSKKKKIESKYRDYINKKASEYSLCSWDNRPLSRSQMMGSVKKQKEQQ